VLRDATSVRAHQHASGGAQKKGPQALGRSRGGLSSTVYVVADARGRLVRCRLTAGQRPDAPWAVALLQGRPPAYVVADRADDSAPLVAARADRGIGAVLPPRRKRRHPRGDEAARYAHALRETGGPFSGLGWPQPCWGYVTVNTS
jgi:hypothetical protein